MIRIFRNIIALGLALGPLSGLAQPRLAVVIVVDQMRASYLGDFDADFESGFRRLLDNGAVFANAFHDHALTETSPGHSTIVTGVYPSRHGVIGNDIWDRQTRELIGVVLDRDSRMVGAERRTGRSPYRLMRTAVGDWLRQQSPQSEVLGVSLKDRSAMFAAGKRPDGAYWYDERTGRFVTSDYYRDALPAWVVAFNDSAPVDAYFGQSWMPRYADEHYVEHEPVAAQPTPHVAYSEFPHLLVGEGTEPDRRFYTDFRLTPFADRLTLDFAERLIEAESLGGDAAPDLLFVGLSASDYIGHQYGPWSSELHDHYARLDGYLGEFLGFLDAKVGAGNYLVVLTADHGVLPVPERIVDHGQAAGRMHWDELLAELQPIVVEAYSHGIVSSLPRLRYEFGVIFDFGEAEVPVEESDALADVVAAHLSKHPFVTAAFTHKQLRAVAANEAPEIGLFRRSFYAERSPDVVLWVKENHLVTDRVIGTTHVSPYAYDRQVPLIFYGDGIQAGVRTDVVRTVDIAPTLARVLDVIPPTDLDGADLSRLLAGDD